MNKVLTLLIILFLYNSAINACIVDGKYTIEERALLSDILIEGKIIDQESIWLEAEQRIITIHTIEVEKNFLSNKSESIKMITNGGIVGDEWHESSADLKIELGQKGIFFLEKEKAFCSSASKTISANYAHFGKSSCILLSEYSSEAKDEEKIYLSKNDIYNKLPLAKYKNEAKTNYNNENLKQSSTMQINCFYPDVIGAGSKDTLIIQGIGFGQYNENTSKILFRNTATGGFDYIVAPEETILDWSDKEILLTVPQFAGTGDFQVINAQNESITSSEEIYIPYALKAAKSNSKPTFLVDQNNSGGYTFALGSNFINTPAQAAFSRALITLQEKIGFNANLDLNTTAVSTPSADGINAITFNTDVFPLSSVAVAYSQFRRCGNGWEVAGVDVFFRAEQYNNVSWHYDETPPPSGVLDFESVALHELLHTFQLNHNNEMESVMYYTYIHGTDKRVLTDCFDLKAAKAIHERSINYSPTCSGYQTYQPLSTFTGFEIDESACLSPSASCLEANLRTRVFLQGYYQNDETMYAEYAEKKLLPIEQPFNISPWYYAGTESFNYNGIDVSKVIDWVLIEIYDESDPMFPVLKKAGILRNDGKIIEADGSADFFLNTLDVNSNYFFKVIQSNHLEIMSAKAINFIDVTFYDFTKNVENTLGEVINIASDGNLVLYAGDFDSNGIINNLDYNAWAINSALIETYLPIDVDGNAIINNLDYNEWAKNRAKVSPSAYLQ